MPKRELSAAQDRGAEGGWAAEERGADSSGGGAPQHATAEEWDEWLALYASRDEVAGAYAVLLGEFPVEWVGWRELNEAILRRWSPAGLRYIKEKAWKIPA